MNDAVLVEDVRNQGDPEQSDCGEREPQRDTPKVNVALRTKFGRARGEHANLSGAEIPGNIDHNDPLVALQQQKCLQNRGSFIVQ